MSTHRDADSAQTPGSPERERVALSLLRRAGRRVSPPPDLGERVHSAVLEVWIDEVRRRQRTRRRLMAAAAVAALVAGAAFFSLQKGVAAVDVASITRFNSSVTVVRDGEPQQLSGAFELKAGDSIDVPTGGSLAAQRPDGISVRISGPAYLVWDSPDVVRLKRGRLYVDMGMRANPGSNFEVRTPLARIEHVGTRFVADANPTRVRVAVREGSVRLTSANGVALGLRRGQAAIAAADGAIAWATPPLRTDWEWVEALAPPCGIEGRSLFDVLHDLAREADLELAFASPEVKRHAHGLTLHGPALDLPPRTAIDAILATTDLDADLTGQRVVLRNRVMSGT